MPTTHTIQQGETLTRIAQQYKFTSWKDLYNHPDNAQFRTLRDNPDIILPGDQIIIPDPEPKKVPIKAGASHTFQLKKEVEYLNISLKGANSDSLKGTRVVLNVGEERIDLVLSGDKPLKVPLSNGNEASGVLEIYDTPEDEEPSQTIDLLVGHLDPVEELSGIQARCNMLGHHCGVVDGIMGGNTREGVKSFQLKYQLEVDGEPGSKTQEKLKEIYGC